MSRQSRRATHIATTSGHHPTWTCTLKTGLSATGSEDFGRLLGIYLNFAKEVCGDALTPRVCKLVLGIGGHVGTEWCVSNKD